MTLKVRASRQTAWLSELDSSLELPPGTNTESWLISARSYLVDRFQADFERILLPAKPVGGGKLKYSRITQSGLPRNLARRLPYTAFGLSKNHISKIFIDLRKDSPGNWAHFLTIHLPIVFQAIQVFGFSFEDIAIILPKKTPKHILDAAALFDLEAVCTNKIVTGTGIQYDLAPLEATRNHRAKWVQLDFVQNKLSEAKHLNINAADIPNKVFLSRRDSRRIRNEKIIEDSLSRLGFRKVYAEDLAAIDQFRLFEEAESIVAVHGAAIAPLLYRPLSARPLSLIELFPCGHLTDVWRTVAHQVGAQWIGVRGRIRPEHIKEVYRLDRPFLRYSLQDFDVDPDSLLTALDWMGDPEAQPKAPSTGVSPPQH